MIGTGAAGKVIDAVMVLTEEAATQLLNRALFAIQTRALPLYANWNVIDPAVATLMYPVIRKEVFALLGAYGGIPSVYEVLAPSDTEVINRVSIGFPEKWGEVAFAVSSNALSNKLP